MTTTSDQLIDEVRRSLRDQADAVVVTDEPFDPARSGLALDPEIDDRRGRPSRRLAVVGVAAAVCVVVGVVAVVAGHDRGSRVDSAGPPPTTATATWLAPTGPEKPMPAFPDGWQLLDYGAVRFAVPAGWVVVNPGGCPPGDAGVPGYVLVQSAGDVIPYCPAMIGPAAPMVSVTADAPSLKMPTGPRRAVGTFSAVSESFDCGTGCSTNLRLDNNYLITVTGPDTDEILATFTDSGRVRALQAGPTVDRSGWQTVTYGSISFEVPPDWATVDLPAGVSRTGAGVTASHLDPGGCDGPYFGSGAAPTVFLGTTGIIPRCASSWYAQLTPADGAWIREPGATTLPKTPDTGPPPEDPQITVIPSDPIHPVVELSVAIRGTADDISVGVGPDPAVARTILQSIRPA